MHRYRSFVAPLVFGLTLLLNTPVKSQEQEVVYELISVTIEGFTLVSLLDHIHEDESGNQVLTQVEIRGTFSAVLYQSNQGVGVAIRNIDFRSVSGPEYRVTGRGGYSIFYPFPDRIPPSGLPGFQDAWLNLEVNGFQGLRLVTPELGIGNTFPPFGAGLVGVRTSPQQRDFFGVTFHAAPKLEEATRFFRRGDVSGDGKTNVTDPIYLLAFSFFAGDSPSCLDAADCNDDGKLDVSDPVYLLGSLFLGEGRFPVPAPLCGLDPTGDELDCKGQEDCMRRDSGRE